MTLPSILAIPTLCYGCVPIWMGHGGARGGTSAFGIGPSPHSPLLPCGEPINYFEDYLAFLFPIRAQSSYFGGRKTKSEERGHCGHTHNYGPAGGEKCGEWIKWLVGWMATMDDGKTRGGRRGSGEASGELFSGGGKFCCGLIWLFWWIGRNKRGWNWENGRWRFPTIIGK